MNHIHIEIKPGAVATFSQEPTKETLEAVKKLIEAAEKKLNEPEQYAKANQDYYKEFSKDKIYPIRKCESWNSGLLYLIKNDEGKLRSYTHNYFETVTQQDYINQELLEEAKRRYPVGCTVKELTVVGDIATIKEHHDAIGDVNSVWFKGYASHGNSINVLVHKNGQWAEIITEEKKPLFEFERHKYFEGDMVWWFIKRDYNIRSKTLGYTSKEGDALTSKIFPTEQQCKEALYNHIWDNHKISEAERDFISKAFWKTFPGKRWKQFFCETIIKQQNK